MKQADTNMWEQKLVEEDSAQKLLILGYPGRFGGIIQQEICIVSGCILVAFRVVLRGEREEKENKEGEGGGGEQANRVGG